MPNTTYFSPIGSQHVALAVFAAGGVLCFEVLKRRRQDRQRHMTPAL
jgi:hypothetical protein